jgi:predicted nuclease of predicted toxin-antitoxin system
MRFFLDMNIPYSALKVFEELKLESSHARDVGLNKADDGEIAGYAKKKQSILLTKDLEFANAKLFPFGSHEGLIIMRLPTFFKASQFVNVLRDFLVSINIKDLNNAVAIVKPGKYRIRKFG